MSKKIAKTEFVGLPISKSNETAILAIAAQRRLVERQFTDLDTAISDIVMRLAREAGWGEVPATELRIDPDGAGGLVLKRQEAPTPSPEKPPA